MIILGIDPGSRRAGYGVVEVLSGKKTKLLDAGLLEVKSKTEPEALFELRASLLEIIKKWRPDALGIEKLFFSKNQKTAIAVAQARGVFLSAAAENGLLIFEYSPNEVKAGVGGYGLADKRAILKMVCLILGEPELKVVDDAVDALAIAIFCAQDSLSRPPKKS